MTKSSYLIWLFAALVVVLSVFGLLHFYHLLHLSLPLFKLILILLPCLVVVGALIMVPGFSKSAEQFVMRFMILTTVQMLAVLSVIAAVWYTQKTNLKQFGLQLIVVFIAMLAVQSVLLVLVNRKQG